MPDIVDKYKTLGQLGAAQRATDLSRLNNPVPQVFESLNFINSAQSLSEMIRKSNAATLSLDSLNAINSAQSVAEMLHKSSAATLALDSLNVVNSVQSLTEMFRKSSAPTLALDSLNAINTVQSVAEMSLKSSAATLALDSLNVVNSVQSLTEMFRKSSAPTLALDSLNKITRNDAFLRSVESIVKNDYLSSAIDVFDNSKSHTERDKTLNTDEIIDNLRIVSKCENVDSFIKALEILPNSIIGIIILQIFLPIIVSVIGGLITYNIVSGLEEKSVSKNEIIKSVKETLSAYDLNTNNLRVISGHSVRLRSKPNRSSEIIRTLNLGDVVIVVEKKKNWIKVMDGSRLACGWVFTRYTSKLKQ